MRIKESGRYEIYRGSESTWKACESLTGNCVNVYCQESMEWIYVCTIQDSLREYAAFIVSLGYRKIAENGEIMDRREVLHRNCTVAWFSHVAKNTPESWEKYLSAQEALDKYERQNGIQCLPN